MLKCGHILLAMFTASLVTFTLHEVRVKVGVEQWFLMIFCHAPLGTDMFGMRMVVEVLKEQAQLPLLSLYR